MHTPRAILCGFGKVGRAFAELLQEKREALRTTYHLDLRLAAVVDIGGAALAPRASHAIPLAALLAYVKAGGMVEGFGDAGQPGATGEAVIQSLTADLLIEATPTNLTTGEPGLGHMRAALTRGMDVVAANKGPLVLRYAELQALAREHDAHIGMSAATAAALPTLDVGQFCLAGARILRIEGILNGTTNFILTKMQREGCDYRVALQEAQARGIAETDPTLDVEGFDTANKLVLLSNALLGTAYRPHDVARQGITHLTSPMLAAADQAGNVLKLIGRAAVSEGIVRLTVAPEELPLDHPLASVHGAEKAVTYETDSMGRVTVSGGQSSPAGAAAALLKDIINLCRGKPLA
ncbi:MAG: homoserine dehydrogenase [Nitrospinae bacterium]|nr:homoserine dehydrogenase [Nitrospinota bacterium]